MFGELQLSILELPRILLHMDNHGAMALTRNEGTKRSKHINARFHHIRGSRAMGLITVKGVPSTDMAAHGLTKPFSKDNFNRFLSLTQMDDGSRGGLLSADDDNRRETEADEERRTLT